MEKAEFEIEARRLRPLLLRYAMSLLHNFEEAEDIVQESLLKLWFFRDRLVEYRSIDAVAYVITGRLSFNLMRSRKVKIPLDESLLTENHEIRENNRLLAESIHKAMDELPATEQAVMKMKHIQGMETEEIASLISSNPTAVRTALSRARKKMRDKFLSEKS